MKSLYLNESMSKGEIWLKPKQVKILKKKVEDSSSGLAKKETYMCQHISFDTDEVTVLKSFVKIWKLNLVGSTMTQTLYLKSVFFF